MAFQPSLNLVLPPKKLTYKEIMEEAAKYVADEKPRILSPEDTADFFRPICQGEKQETLYVAYLDTRNQVIRFDAVTKGLSDRTSIHAREVFRAAIVANASRIILVHNHPSGDPTPSQGDIRSTREMVEAGKILGIEVTDHIVIGEKSDSRKRDYSSLRELGYV